MRPVTAVRASRTSVSRRNTSTLPTTEVESGGGKVEVLWLSELASSFNAELINILTKAWERIDRSARNALGKEQVEEFLRFLYETTEQSIPDDTTLRQEVSDIFRRYDLDRNMFIEVPEMCCYLKYSHFYRSLTLKYAKRSRLKKALTLLAPNGEDEVKRPSSPISPWFLPERGITERTISALDCARQEAITTAASSLGRFPASACPSHMWFREVEKLRVFVRQINQDWTQTDRTVLDELADNLVFPDERGVSPYTVLYHISQALKARYGARFPDLSPMSLTVVVLLTLAGNDIDRLVGFNDVPPATDAAALAEYQAKHSSERNASLRQSLADWCQSFLPELEVSVRKLESFRSLAGTATREPTSPVAWKPNFSIAPRSDASKTKWIRTLCALSSIARPSFTKGGFLTKVFSSVPNEALDVCRGLQKGDTLGFTSLQVCTKSDRLPNPKSDSLFLRIRCSSDVVDLRLNNTEDIALPPFTVLEVESAKDNNGVTIVGTSVGLGDGEMATLRKRATDDLALADKQLDMVRSIILEKELDLFTAAFERVFNVSRSGKLSREELMQGMRCYGESLAEEDASSMIQIASADGSSFFLTIDDFIGALIRPQTLHAKVSSPPRKAVSMAQINSNPKPRGKRHTSLPPLRNQMDPARAMEVIKWWSVVQANSRHALDTYLNPKVARPDRFLPPSLKTIKTNRTRRLRTIPSEWQEGDIVILEPGEYKGSFVINASGVVLRGEEDQPKPTIVASTKEGQAVITLASKRVVLDGLHIHNTGEGQAVGVRTGHHDIMNCSVSGFKGCILCHPGSNIHIRGCNIHGSRRYGLCLKGSQESRTTGIIEDCSFSSNTDGGLVVEKHASPWVGNCTFTNGKGCGVVFVGGGGVLVNCTIASNACAGVWIEQDANPVVCRNNIHNGCASGIKVENNGQGLIIANRLSRNAFHEIEVTKGANPLCQDNVLQDGTSSAIYVAEGGRGIFANNDIRWYQVACITIGPKGSPIVTGNQMWYDEAGNPEGHAVGIRADAMGLVAENMMVGWVGTDDALKTAMFGITGQHQVVLERNYTGRTWEEAKAERRAALFAKYVLD